MGKLKLSIKIKPYEIPSGHNFQPWIKKIGMIDDSQLEKTNDATFGLFNCTKCDVYQPYHFKLPPLGSSDPVSKEAHNEWVDFQLKHAHGDGRVALFERKM